MSFNKVTIVGNLGRDPELRYTPQGQAVCSLNVASSEKRKLNGDTKEIVTWFKVTLWGKTAENAAKWLSKGSQVYLEGRLTIEEWQDREGKDRYTLAVNGTDMQFLASGKNEKFEDAYAEPDEQPAKKAPAKPKAKAVAAAAEVSDENVDPDDDINF